MASQSISFRPTAVIRQLPWNVDQRAALGLLLILVTFSLVGWLYLGQASVITSSTLQIEQLQRELKFIDQKNAELAVEIAEMEKLSRIEERARALGFSPVNPTTIRYLPVDSYPVLESNDPLTLISVPEPNKATWQIWFDNFVAWVAGQPTQS